MITDETVAKVVKVARALADPTRVQLLALLRDGRECCDLPCCILPDIGELQQAICNCELKEILGVPQSNVSYHIKILREAGLVKEFPAGKWSYIALESGAEGILHALLSSCELEEEKKHE